MQREVATTETGPGRGVGPRAFLTVWAGQLVSVTGSNLTGFALQVWVYLETGSVTRLALVSLAFALPSVLLSPLAGALVDRWDRRLVMLGADALAGAATLAIAALYFTGHLQVWHLYVITALGYLGNAFQMPAWMAAIPLLVPKAQLGRANGLVQLTDAVALVAAPALAGAILATLGLGAVLIIDLATFAVAIATLAVVRFPRPPLGEHAPTGSVRADVAAGWRYLRQRTGLVWLLVIYAGVNFVLSFATVLLIPMLVSFTTEATAGAVFSAAGAGMLVGSLVVSAWGGPKGSRVAWIMGTMAVGGVAVAVMALRPPLVMITVGALVLMLGTPLVNTTSQVIWQLKVAPEVQGRVFSLRRMIAQGAAPVAIVVSGPLADRVFEPLLAPGGGLAGTVGRVIGTGPGRGIAFMFVLAGAGMILMSVLGWLQPRVRRLESEIPDQLPDEPAPAA